MITRGIIVISILSFLIMSPGLIAEAQQASSYTTSQPDTEWSKDLSKKMDTAIKLLSVIKEEVQKSDAEKMTLSDKGPYQPDLGDEVKEKTSLFVRIWRRIMGITQEGAQKTTLETEDWTENLEKNVDLMVNIGEKVNKIMAEYTATTGPVTTGGPGSADWNEDMQLKIDKTIKVLDAVKGELDKKDEIDKEKTKTGK